jgi:hypothetical protein
MRDAQFFGPVGQPVRGCAIGVEDKRATIEYQFILPTNAVQEQ